MMMYCDRTQRETAETMPANVTLGWAAPADALHDHHDEAPLFPGQPNSRPGAGEQPMQGDPRQMPAISVKTDPTLTRRLQTIRDARGTGRSTPSSVVDIPQRHHVTMVESTGRRLGDVRPDGATGASSRAGERHVLAGSAARADGHPGRRVSPDGDGTGESGHDYHRHAGDIECEGCGGSEPRAGVSASVEYALS